MRTLDEGIFDLDVHLIPARTGEPAHYHYDVRFLVQAMEDRFRVSEESCALAWVPADRVGVFTSDESVLRMARKWVARRAGGKQRGRAAESGRDPRPGGREKMNLRTDLRADLRGKRTERSSPAATRTL